MRIQPILWIVFVTLIMLIFQGCGTNGSDGAPGVDSIDGVIVEVPAEIEEGLDNGLACLKTALPDFYLKSLHVHENNQEIHIKLKEVDK